MRLNFRAAACRNGGEHKHIIHFLPFYPRLDARAKLSAEDEVPEKIVLGEVECFKAGAA